MITYVDYVEYDGPAFKAGMREGDVILSINGTDMEKTDHKTLVSFIQNCDNRMRMVVLFEDCVRKVELHMRYIQLQSVLQAKMNELERTCMKERELLEGKWKTHSLPAPRKKASSTSVTNTGAPMATMATPSDENLMLPTINDFTAFPNTRPISSEDVNLTRPHGKYPTHIIPPPAQFMLTYQYLDPRYRYVLKPSTSGSSGEYLLSIEPPPRSKSEHQQFYSNNGSVETMQSTLNSSQDNFNCDKQKRNSVAATVMMQREEPITKPSKSRHFHGHSCNPCLGQRKDKNGDNVSLDAYDLASPCCNPQCVPTRKRTKPKEHKHKHREKETKERSQRPRSQSHATQYVADGTHHFHPNEKHVSRRQCETATH